MNVLKEGMKVLLKKQNQEGTENKWVKTNELK